MRKIFFTTLGFVFVLISDLSVAKEYNNFGPVACRVQSPLYLQSLGLTPQMAKVIPDRDLKFSIDTAYSNMFEMGENSKDNLYIDMELLRLALNLSYGMKDIFEVGAELPFYHTWHGFLDGFIQGFHKIFGFPNAGRERYGNNGFKYYLKRDNRDIFNYSPQTFSVGDLRLYFKNQINEEGKYAPLVSWFTDLKFPTGDKGGGVGSGNFDFGLGVALQKSYKRLHGYLNAEYIVAGGNDIFGSDQHDANLGFMAGLEFTILPTWSVIAQVLGSTPMYDGTGLHVYEGIPLDLLIGFRGRETEIIKSANLNWQFGFAEDVTAIGPSVDFTIFASIGFDIDFKSKGSQNTKSQMHRAKLDL